MVNDQVALDSRSTIKFTVIPRAGDLLFFSLLNKIEPPLRSKTYSKIGPLGGARDDSSCLMIFTKLIDCTQE